MKEKWWKYDAINMQIKVKKKEEEEEQTLSKYFNKI